MLSSTSVSVGAGLAAGIALSVGFDQFARQWLAESSRDPVILGCLALLMVAVAGLACWVPARRAGKVDPLEALRYE